MNQSVFCSHRHGAPRIARWAIYLLPLLFAGCFDSQSATEKSKNGTKLGIAAIGRFFTFGRTPAANKAPETAPEAPFLAPTGVPGLMDPANDAAELSVEIPDFLSAYRSAAGSAIKTGGDPVSPFRKAKPERSSNFGTMASAVFNSPFSQLFSSVFQVNQVDDVFLNPFTEAKQKQETSSAQAATPETNKEPEKASSDTSTPAEAPAEKTADPPVAPAGTGAHVESLFLIVGDFDGSGTLGAVTAKRSGETEFSSEDGKFHFDLFVNSSAVKYQRSLYIDDINGDRVPDLLTASGIAMYGSVLLGDGAGGFQRADKFMTGYQPTVPSAGPFRDGRREIATVNTETGRLRTFHATDHYRLVLGENLPFAPDYLLHLVAQDNSLEFLMIAQVNGPRQILVWKDDASLKPTAEALPVDPLVLSVDLEADSLQAYQVGDYASILLTSQGRTFNVANLRLFPGVFLVIGNLLNDESTDVAVGSLKLFTPSGSTR